MSTPNDTDKTNCAKNRILHAAGKIFAEKGFRCSTVREICDAADVNIASVNYYFGDKKSLYQETLLLAREIGAQKFPTPDFSALATSEDRLRSIILLLLNRLVGSQTEPWPVKILMSEILSPSPAAKPLIDGYIDPFLRMVFTTVRQLADDSLSDSQIHQLSFSVISQCVWYRFAGDVNRMVITDEQYSENFSVNQLAKQIFDFSLAGIRAAVKEAQNANLAQTKPQASPIKPAATKTKPAKATGKPSPVVEKVTSPV